MKTIALITLSILNISLMNNSQACSQAINQLFDKNLLVAYAAGSMNVDLAKSNSISIIDYSFSTYGVDAGSNCDAFLDSQARISVNYKPNLFTNCSFSVTIRKVEQIGMTPKLDQPMLNITTEMPVSGCSITHFPIPLPHP